MDDETLKKYAFVSISKHRLQTVKSLKDNVKIPTQIAEDTGIRRNHISKVLRELKENGIAECVNEDVKKGRIYRLTKVGEDIVDYIDDY